MAVAKRPRASGPSIGGPSVAARPAVAKASVAAPTTVAPRGAGTRGPSPPSPLPPPISSRVVPRDAVRGKGEAPMTTAPSVPGPSGASGSASNPEAARDMGGLPGHRTTVTREVLPHGWIYHVRTGTDDSALRSPAVARELLKVALHPRDLEDAGMTGLNDLVDGAFLTYNKALHELFAMRAFLLKYGERVQTLESEAAVAAAQVAKADRERALSEQLRGELASRLKEKEELLGKKCAEAASFEHQLSFSESQRQLAVSRMLGFEESAKAADDRAKAAAAKAQAAEERAEAAEAKAKAAEAKAAGAVEEYQNSSAFETDVADAGAEAYNFGYDDCLAKVADLWPELDLSRLNPASAPATEEGQEEGEVAPDTGDDGDEVVEIPAPTAVVVEGPSPPAIDGFGAPCEEQPATEAPPTPPTPTAGAPPEEFPAPGGEDS